MSTPAPTSQPNRVSLWVAGGVAVLALAIIAWAGISGSGRGDDEPSGTPIASGSATAPPTDPRLARFYDQQLAWKDCDDTFECASLTVPLDYAAPDGETLDLAVIRSASRSGDRIGSLVVNPGGPGGSGIDYVRAVQYVTTSALREAYDIVGFDPRGVGQSDPVRCLSAGEIDTWLAADGTPDTAAERDDIIRFARTLGEKCARLSPTIVSHVDTISAARDIDILREALGEERLTWLGKSYGTYLGAQYAELFPGRVGRMVLDGALDPDADLIEITRGQALGFEVALDRFLQDCIDSRECPFTGSVADARALLQSWIDSAEAEPYPTDDPDRPLTESLIYYGVLLGLYDTQFGWEALRLGLESLKATDGTALLALIDAYTGREDGRFTDNGLEALNAVTCLDTNVRPSLQQVEALGNELSTSAPFFGQWLAWGALACTYWPYPSDNDGTISVNGVPDILVIGTKYDPATPVQWATRLHDKIENARLVTWNGDGHTAYMQAGSRCVDRIVDAYFISGLTPDDGTVCD